MPKKKELNIWLQLFEQHAHGCTYLIIYRSKEFIFQAFLNDEKLKTPSGDMPNSASTKMKRKRFGSHPDNSKGQKERKNFPVFLCFLTTERSWREIN